MLFKECVDDGRTDGQRTFIDPIRLQAECESPTLYGSKGMTNVNRFHLMRYNSLTYCHLIFDTY